MQEMWDGTRQVRIFGPCMARPCTRARRCLPEVRSRGEGVGVPGMQSNKAEGSFYRVHVAQPSISKNTLPCLRWRARSDPVQHLQDAEDEGRLPASAVEAQERRWLHSPMRHVLASAVHRAELQDVQEVSRSNMQAWFLLPRTDTSTASETVPEERRRFDILPLRDVS